MKIGLILFSLLGVSCMHKFPQNYPQAAKKPHALSKHGDTRLDNYFWLRERESEETLSYLKAENAYTENVMAPVKDLEERLFTELKSRVKEDDSSYPFKRGNYYYQTQFKVGQQYPIYVRHVGSADGPEEVLLDVNQLAQGHTFFDSTGPMMSPNQEWMAYGTDTVGRRFYHLSFKNIKTGEVLKDQILNSTGNMTWAADNKTVFFSQQNPETLRAERIFRYVVGSKQAPELIYFEKDETYRTYVYSSLSKKFIYIGSNSTLTSEIRYLSSSNPTGKFEILAPRQTEHDYQVTDDGENFYIVSNLNAKNFKLMKASPGKTQISQWQEIVPHRADTLLDSVTVFKNHIVLTERFNGLNQLSLTDHQGKNTYTIPFPDQSYMADEGANAEFDTDVFRYEYQSMRLPLSTFDINMVTHKQELKKTKEVPNYNPELYKAERVFITARDGTKVPVSLLMKKDHKLDGTAPILVYGYGSYGANMDAGFGPTKFSLVDRGFVFAIAHIRGGSEMGRHWYDDGRTVNKLNSFYDFIDATEFLVKNKYADPKKVYAMGGSAGGLLMGAVINMRPDLYHGIVAQVPFVDVVTTMLDDTIPLTTNEYDEWGNPNEKAAYDYIKAYSPYDNIQAKAYPNMLVTTGLHDSQVQYWEPAKWVAKIRELKTSDNIVLLKTDMEAGHGGASGRFNRLKEIATEYAFILMLEGKH